MVGTNSAFQVETFGKPRRIAIDPDNRVLKNSQELKVRASIMRGQGMVEQGDLSAALQEFQKSLDANKHSSLAHYRIAEVFFLQKNTRRRPMPIARRSTGMENRAGPRSGAISSSARFSTSPASASARPTNIARHCKPTTIPRARWEKRASIFRRRSEEGIERGGISFSFSF